MIIYCWLSFTSFPLVRVGEVKDKMYGLKCAGASCVLNVMG